MERVKHQQFEHTQPAAQQRSGQRGSDYTPAFPLARIRICGQLTLEVLQGVQIANNGQQEAVYGPPDPTLLTRKGSSTALILLALLVSQQGCFASKDWLSEKLAHGRSLEEDEDDEREGMKRVDNVVSRLRFLLFPVQEQEGRVEQMMRRRLVEYQRASGESGPGYQLAGMPWLWLDVAEIEAHLKRAKRLEQFGHDGLAEWQSAYDLAMGGRFLPGEIYSDWAQWRRQQLETHLWDCVQVLWHRAVEQGPAGEAQAVRVLRDYWHSHPTNEDALRPLLELLGTRECFGEAQTCYDQLCAALADEGKQPDQRTQEVMDFLCTMQVKRQRVAAGKAARPSHPHPSAPFGNQEQEEYALFTQAVKHGILAAIQELAGEDMDHLRRQFLQHILALGSTTLFSPEKVLLPSTPQVAAGQPSPSSFHLYDSLLSLSWEQYYTSSSQSLLPIIDDCLHSLGDFTKEARDERTRTAALILLCRFYQLSGVVARDHLNISRALADGKKAIELAFAIDNAELIAASLFRRAKTHLKQNTIDKAHQDIDAALIYAHHSRDPLKGYVHQAAAEVSLNLATPHDQHGENKSLALLDCVENLLCSGPLEEDGSFVKTNIAGLSIDRARVLAHFQRPQEARQTLLIAQHHLGAELTRWQCRFLVADAEIYLAERDVQSCCNVLSDALKMAQATRSRSNEAKIGALYSRLKMLAPDSSSVRQLGEQFHSS